MNKVIISISVGIAILLGVLFLLKQTSGALKHDTTVICTQEAKECPDGSFVGRSGPQCQFAQCPGEQSADNSIR